MDITEKSLEWFVKHVCEMILKLLCPLNREKVVTACGETAKIFCLVAVVTVAQLI